MLGVSLLRRFVSASYREILGVGTTRIEAVLGPPLTRSQSCTDKDLIISHLPILENM